ncbi:hypothetical protein I6E52_06680 [Salinibacterium sp. NG253]|uniref:hypothetical protein n=1 Tax=Salinibacterium sp. NG253 TaxID=2792039 RepID=UPI0018CF97D0|nr:hypothetical protein [Salinibacterium sp. NG253]MBH0116529.1 hypothetical protein [Salinibacterium sp. NG253]
MTSSRRLPALISGAVALSLVLGGCSLVEQAMTSAGEGVLAHAALAAAVADIEALDAVEDASYEIQADASLGDIGRISVTADPALDSVQLAQFADQFRDSFVALEQVTLRPQLSLKLAGETAGKFDLWVIPPTNDGFVENFEFWRAASAAVETELWLEIFPSSSQGIRSIAIPFETDLDAATDRVVENYEALEAFVAVDSLVFHETEYLDYWQIAGVQSIDELAPFEFVELVRDLREIVPLFSFPEGSEAFPGDADYPEGLSAQWGGPLSFSGRPEIAVLSNEYSDEAWSTAVQAAVRTIEMANVNFKYSAGDRTFSLHTSACSGSVDATADDVLLFETLVDYGVTPPFGGGPGACTP